MTKAYECLECSFECYNLSVAKKHLERTNHQVVPAGQKNIVKEVKEPQWIGFANVLQEVVEEFKKAREVKDSREDWEPGILILRGFSGYRVSHWGAEIGIYDTLSEAQDAIAAWTDHADTCETCSDGFPGAASHV